MGHLLSVEIDNEVAARLLERLEKQPMPPMDEEDHDAYLLKIAIEEAIENDDG